MIKQFYLTLMEPLEVLPLQVRVDLGVMGMKEYFSFSKAPGLEHHHQMVPGHSFDGGSLTSLQLTYSTAPADWTKVYLIIWALKFNVFIDLFFLYRCWSTWRSNVCSWRTWWLVIFKYRGEVGPTSSAVELCGSYVHLT